MFLNYFIFKALRGKEKYRSISRKERLQILGRIVISGENSSLKKLYKRRIGLQKIYQNQ